MEGDLAWGVKHTIKYTDDVIQNCIPEIYMILLTNVALINSMKKEKRKRKPDGIWNQLGRQLDGQIDGFYNGRIRTSLFG